MAIKIETQRTYIVENSLTFQIPSSYDPSWNTLRVFAALAGTDQGVPVQFRVHSSGESVVVEEALTAGDVVVVRVIPMKETQFTKATRQALSSNQVNAMYEHSLAMGSSADDKILSEYGITITGNIPPEDIALADDLEDLEVEVDNNTDAIFRNSGIDPTAPDSGDGILKRLDTLEQGGSNPDLAKSSQSQAIAGTDDSTYMTPLRVRDVETWHDVKAMVITVLSNTEDLSGSVDGIISMPLPKMLDGMYIKDFEVATKANSSANNLTVSLKVGEVVYASAVLPSGTLNVSKDDPDVAIPTLELNAGSNLSVDLANEARTITGLVLTVTVGWSTSRYV